MLGTQAAVSVDIGERSFAHVKTKSGTSNEYFDGFASRWAQAYRVEIEDFASCLRTGKNVRVDINDGREALKIGLAARASIAEGRPMLVKRE
jgi:scyllo-inositol 2-dehydrogenase (NAD+)